MNSTERNAIIVCDLEINEIPPELIRKFPEVKTNLDLFIGARVSNHLGTGNTAGPRSENIYVTLSGGNEVRKYTSVSSVEDALAFVNSVTSEELV